MTGVPRSRPAKQPNWRPGDRQEVHPLRRWIVRLAWTIVAIALVAAFVMLMPTPGDREKVAFVPLTIENYDPGELPPPAFANSDRGGLAILKWTVTNTPKFSDPLKASAELGGWKANVDGKLDTLICYISSHVAVRPFGDKENHVCLIAPDFRRAQLAGFIAPGNNSPAVDVREFLQAMKQVPADVKLLLMDSPRVHAEPWLAALGKHWTETLAADVKATGDPNLWVLVPGGSDTVSRITHYAPGASKASSGNDPPAPGSLFSQAVADAFTAREGEDGKVTLSTLRKRLNEALGHEPLVLHASSEAQDPELLPHLLLPPAKATTTETEAAPASETSKPGAAATDSPDAKVTPPDPISLAWQASDELLDVEQNKFSIGPNDYAPDLWRKLQSIMVWHDWAARTGWTPPGGNSSDDPFADLVAAKPMLALAPNPAGASPRHPAIVPFREAIDGFKSDEAAWKASPPGYRFAVRRRNLLAARVPDYWRWKTACGFDPTPAKADLDLIHELSDRIAAVSQQQDGGAASELEAWSKTGDVQELFQRVTTEFSAVEVTPLCDRKATPGKTPDLDAPTQFAIEQLLLTALPNAADRDRLWKSLRESTLTPGKMTRPSQVVNAQAQFEAMLVQFATELAEPLNLIDAERLQQQASAVNAAAVELADGENADATVEFVRQLGAYNQLLASAAPRTPDNAVAELFVRFADPLVPRAPRSATLASLPKWNSPLKPIYDDELVLTNVTEANINLELKGAPVGKTPSFQFKSIPSGLVVEHGGKPIREREPLTSDKFEFRITVDRNLISEPKALLEGEAWVAGSEERKAVNITVTLPTDSAFELVSTGATGLVKRQTSAGAPQLVLLAFTQQPPTEFSLGVKRNSGPEPKFTASLYALDEQPPNTPLPQDFEALKSAARLLDVQVAVGKESSQVSPLKFLPAAPPAPPAASTTSAAAPPPPAASSGEISLSSKYLAIVLEEPNAIGAGAAIHHVLWLAIEPLHPDRYVAAPRPAFDGDEAQKRFQIPIRAKTSVGGDVAIPSGGVTVSLGGSEVFRGVDRTIGDENLTASLPIDASIDFPDEGADLTDARLFLDVGGYPRAFIWNVSDNGSITSFQGSRIAFLEPEAPDPDDPPLSRPSNKSIDVAFEIDCDDPNCWVEMELRLFKDSGDGSEFDQFLPGEKPPTVIQRRRWTGTRQIANYLKPTESGRLAVGCKASDYSATLSPGPSQGRGEIWVRVVDTNDRAKSIESRLPILIDGTPPEVDPVSFSETLDHIAGMDLVVPVRVTDSLSGPATLFFWQEEPSMDAGVANPQGQKARLDPPRPDDGGFRDRVFRITLKELPPSSLAGEHVEIYLLAEDRVGNAMKKPKPFVVRYRTRSMDQAAPGKGMPRDVTIQVVYDHPRGPRPSRGASVTLVSGGGRDGEMQAAPPEGAVFLQLEPGTYQFEAQGNMNNVQGIGKLTVTVPPEGDGPIPRTITLQPVPPPPPPTKP